MAIILLANRLRFRWCQSAFVPAMCLALLLCFSTLVPAQTAATGALKGVITDPSGGLVPGVTIRVTSNATGVASTATTQNNGSYLVPLLPPGEYRVETSAKSFKSARFDRI